MRRPRFVLTANLFGIPFAFSGVCSDQLSLYQSDLKPQLAEKGIESWEKRCWMDLPPVEV